MNVRKYSDRNLNNPQGKRAATRDVQNPKLSKLMPLFLEDYLYLGHCTYYVLHCYKSLKMSGMPCTLLYYFWVIS